MRISDGSSDVCSSDLIFGDQIGIVDEIERHAESLGHVAARSLSMNVARPGPFRPKERPPDRGPILLCPEPAPPGEAAPRASSPPPRRAATVSPSPRRSPPPLRGTPCPLPPRRSPSARLGNEWVCTFIIQVLLF